MKKKVVAVCATVALAAVAFGGATLAYFTDHDQVKNTFTIGNLDINLYEKTGVLDKDNNVVQEVIETKQTDTTYSNLMPSYQIVKEPTVKNEGNSDAYVRVAVVMNNTTAINEAIDQVYENKTNPETDKVYTADEIQEIHDYIFDGWGVNYNKRNVDGNNDRRMWMDDRTGEDSPVLWNVDMYCRQPDNGSMYDVENVFKSDTDTDKEGFDYANNGYYRNATKDGSEERIYVFYLKLEAGKSYTLFNGLNVPADFTAEQMKMFDDLQIGIYADAIQTVGFDKAEDAFTQLQSEHPLGWWNN